MALVLPDRVLETSATTGTGTLTLAGAVTGYQSFAAVGNGNTTYYCIADQAGTNWEVGIGTYTSVGTTLSRDTVYSSSNAGALVNFPAGTKNVFVTYPASEATPNSIYGFTTTATAAGTTTLTVNSTYLQYFTGTTTQTVQMPVTSTLILGWSFHIANNSTGNLTLTSSGGNTIATVYPGTTTHITCIDQTVTTAAGWDYGYTDFNTATGTGNVVLSTQPTVTGQTLAAGTTTVAPLTFTSGTNLNTATAGTKEYDGNNFYATVDTTSGRTVQALLQQFYLSAAGSAIGPASSNFFGANSAASMAAASTYDIDVYMYFLKTTAGSFQPIPTWSSAVTVAHAYWEYTPVTGFTTTLIQGAMVTAEATQQTTTTLTFTASANLTTAVYHVHKMRIRCTTNLATNFRMNVVEGAGTITPQAGSYYTVRKVVSTSGNFVA